MIATEDDSRYIPFTPEQLQALKALYLDGQSTRKLSASYGISPCTVRRRLVAMGVTLRDRGCFDGRQTVVTDRVLQTARIMRERRLKWRLVAEFTGVRPDSIMSSLRRQRNAQQ